MTHNIITRYNRLKREMASSKHTLGILNEYGKSKPRVWVEYGWSMVRVWLEANILFPRREQNIPTLGTKHSHVGNKTGLRLFVTLLLMMVMGVSGVKATDYYYFIVNKSGKIVTYAKTTNQSSSTDANGDAIPVAIKSVNATNWKLYNGDKVSSTLNIVILQNTQPSNSAIIDCSSWGDVSLVDSPTQMTKLSDCESSTKYPNYIFVFSDYDENSVPDLRYGTYTMQYRGGYATNDPTYSYAYYDASSQRVVNSGTTVVSNAQNTSNYLWCFKGEVVDEEIDPYDVKIYNVSVGTGATNHFVANTPDANVGDGPENENNKLQPASVLIPNRIASYFVATSYISGEYNITGSPAYNKAAKDKIFYSIWAQYQQNGQTPANFTKSGITNQSNFMRDASGNKARQQWASIKLTQVSFTYIIVDADGNTLVQATSKSGALELPDVIKSPLATYTYYGSLQDAKNEANPLSSATASTIYVKYTTSTDVLNLKGEIKYNISVGGTNYLYAADETTLSSEATSDNNANNNHKWTLTGNDAYQITIKNVDNSKEITYDVSSGEAVPTLSGAGNKFFLHQSTSGQYEVVAITANDYSTPNYYTLGMASSTLKLYSSSNYPIGEDEVQTVITPRATAAITTPPTANSLTYNGSNQNLVTSGTASNGTIKYCLGVPGSYVDAVPKAKDADTYNVYYMAAGDDGYEDFVAAEPIEVTINKQSITVSGITTSNKTYDGNTMATLVYTGATLTGNFDGENLTISAIGTFDNKNVGTDKEVTISDLTLGGSVADNYELAPSGQQTYTTADITAKDITVSGIAASNKTYDGTTTAVFDYTDVTLTGKVIGDDLSVTATGTYDTKDVGTGKAVTISSLTLSGDDKDNYVLAGSGQQESTTANITPATLTVTADNKTVEYGSPAPEYTVTITGFVNNETLSVLTTIPTATCEYTTTSPKGSYDIVPSGGEADNYSFTYVNGTLAVAAAFVTLTANSETVTYSGTEQTITGFTCSVPNLTFTGVSASGSGTAVGTYPVTFTGVTENTTTDSSGDYVVTTIEDGTLTINPATAIVTADDKTKTYGETDPTLTATISGMVNGENTDLISYSLNRATGENAGNYAITSTGETTQGNYTVSYVPGTFTISQKGLTITAQNQTITYGEAPDNGVTYDGFITGESENTEGMFTGTLVYSYNSESNGSGDSYSTIIPQGISYIIPSGLSAMNYDITYMAGTLTVNAKSIGSESLASGFTLEFGTGGTIILKDSETTLPLDKDKDYELVETTSTSGRYSQRTVTGKGNYTGSISFRNANVNFQTDTDQLEWSATFVAEPVDPLSATDNTKGHALPKGVSAYIITGIVGDWAIPEPLDYIPEGIPVLLVSDKASGGFLVEDASSHTAITTTGNGNQKDANKLEVTTSSTHFDAGTIYLLYKNEFVYNMAGDLAAGNVYLNPKHTISSPSPAPSRLRIKWDDVTGIEELQNDGNTETRNDAWYTLDGRRIDNSKLPKGIYITNGRKVIIK